MRTRPRLRRAAKWTGLVMSLLALAAWGASMRYAFECYLQDGRIYVGVGLGSVLLARWEGNGDWRDVFRKDSVHFRRIQPGIAWTELARFLLPAYRQSFVPSVNMTSQALVIPFWLIVALIASPTALLWYKDRRPTEGHCPNCNYNLKANESGKCPECGTPTPASTESSPNRATVGSRGAQVSDSLRQSAGNQREPTNQP